MADGFVIYAKARAFKAKATNSRSRLDNSKANTIDVKNINLQIKEHKSMFFYIFIKKHFLKKHA